MPATTSTEAWPRSATQTTGRIEIGGGADRDRRDAGQQRRSRHGDLDRAAGVHLGAVGEKARKRAARRRLGIAADQGGAGTAASRLSGGPQRIAGDRELSEAENGADQDRNGDDQLDGGLSSLWGSTQRHASKLGGGACREARQSRRRRPRPVPNWPAMRAMVVIWVLILATGIVLYSVIGLTHS